MDHGVLRIIMHPNSHIYIYINIKYINTNVCVSDRCDSLVLMSNGKDEKDNHTDDTNDKYDFMKTKVRFIFLKIVMMMVL